MTVVALLRRFIPIESPSEDICVKICTETTTIKEIIDWQKNLTKGSCHLISLQLVEES